jgi:hypothetical protein
MNSFTPGNSRLIIVYRQLELTVSVDIERTVYNNCPIDAQGCTKQFKCYTTWYDNILKLYAIQFSILLIISNIPTNNIMLQFMKINVMSVYHNTHHKPAAICTTLYINMYSTYLLCTAQYNSNTAEFWTFHS